MALSLFDSFRRDPLFSDWPMQSLTEGNSGGQMARLGATDIVETEKAHVLHIDVPGVNDDSLKVDVQEGVLTISGERQSEYQEGDGSQFHRVERSYGSFQRSFRLPPGTDAEGITAEHKSGQLTVTLPKTSKGKEQQSQIDIKHSS
jgi:HSP20 family protein